MHNVYICYIQACGQKYLDVIIRRAHSGQKCPKKQKEKNVKKNSRLPGCRGLARWAPIYVPSTLLGRRWWMNPITIIIFEYIRHVQYLVYTSIYIPAICTWVRVHPEAADPLCRRQGPTPMRGWTRHLADAAQSRRCAVYPSFLVVIVVILLLFVRSSVHSSPTFNSHEMNIDWQVPRVGVRVGMIAVVVVVFDCYRHRVTTTVTVVRGVGNIMSPRNFPSSSECRLQSAAVAATSAEVVVHLCRWVSRA